MIRHRDVGVAERFCRLGHLLQCVLAVVRPRRVHVEVAAQVSQLDELGQGAVPGCSQLAGALAELRRDPRVAQLLVEVLLGSRGQHLAGLDVLDPVLRDREASLDGVLAEIDVVALRAREMLEQVSVRVGRDDAEVEDEPVVRDDRGLRLPVRLDLRDPRELREVLRQSCGVGGRGDDVEVLHGLGAEPRQRPELLGLRRLAQVVHGRDPQVLPDPPCRLGTECRQAQELGDAGRDALLALGQRLDLAGLDDLDDLGLDRLPDSREVLGLAGERLLCDRPGRRADLVGRPPVCQHAALLLPVELEELGKEVELLGHLRVPGHGRRHVTIIGTCWWSACRPTTSARTSRRWSPRWPTSCPTTAGFSSSTTTLPTAQEGSRTGSPTNGTTSSSCTGCARRGSGPPTWTASGERSGSAPTSSSRWTATSPTTRTTFHGWSPLRRTRTSCSARDTSSVGARGTGA